VEQSLAERVLDAARPVAEQAEVFAVSSRVTSVRFEANSLKEIQTREGDSTTLRIVRGGRIGVAVAGGLGPDASQVEREGTGVSRLVDMAVETSSLGEVAKFAFPSAERYTDVALYDPRVVELPVEAVIDLGRELIARVRDHTPEIVCEVKLTRATHSTYIVNSAGAQASYEKTVFGVDLEGVLVRGTDMLFVGDGDSSCKAPDGPSALTSRVIEQLELARDSAQIRVGQMPVVFTPQAVAGVLLEPLTLPFNGKVLVEGSSALEGRVGEQVFDARLTLTDDSTVPYRPGSAPCDDEGVPGRPVPLIGEGVVGGFLYDLRTAAAAGTRSTGHGRRVVSSGQVRPAPSCLLVERGGVPFPDMVKEMQEGLVVEQLIGAGQGNLLAGDFGGNVLLGYKVERGHIVGRVKDTMIHGNIYKDLGGDVLVGDQGRWVGGSVWTPHLFCARVSVSAG
jgi:PmbA protein